MKKKQNKAKALTANERKELRRKELEKEQGRSSKQHATTSATVQSDWSNDFAETPTNTQDTSQTFDLASDGTAVATKPPRKHFWWIIITAVFLAAILITMGILIPTVIMRDDEWSHIPNPVVVFTLNTGEQIEIIVWERELPHAATNFLHLARIGFFNDTILFDTTHNFVRFGQFEDNTFRNFRTANQRFLNGLRSRDMPTLPDTHANHATQNWSPFDYRIAQDTESTATEVHNGIQRRNRFNERGFVSNIFNMSGTEFQIATRYDAIVQQQSNRPATVTGTRDMRGRFIGEVTGDSLYVLDRIVGLEQEMTEHPFFNPPVENGGNIYIRSTRIHNLSFWGKWRTFNWDRYFIGPPSRVTWSYGGAFNAVRDTRQLITS